MIKNRSVIHFVLVSLVIICIFFSLRIFKLNTLPVFVDEAIYIRWSQVMKNEATLRFLPQSDGKQPLFMWITISAFKIAKDPVIAGRLVSVFAGLGTLIGLGILSYRLTRSRLAAIAAGFIYAVLPFTVFFDRMALADSLLAMFGIWSLVLAHWFATTLRLDAAMLLGFAVGGGLLTKSPAVFYYAWLGLILLFYLPFKTPKKINWFKLISGLFAAFVISQGMFNILRLGPNFHLIGSRNLDYVFPLSEVLTHPLNPLISNLQKTISWLWELLTPPVIALIIASLFFVKSKKTIILFFLISLSALVAQGSIAKVYTSRYIMFATIPLIVPAAMALTNMMTRYHHLLLGVLVWPLIVSYGYAYNPVDTLVTRDMKHGYLEEWTAGWGQREIGDYLIKLSQSKPDQKMVVGTEGFFGTLPDGLQIYTQNYPNIIVIGVGQPLSGLPDSLKNTSKDNLIFLVVNKSRNNIPSHELEKLTLIKEYPKPNRPDGTQEVLQFYQFK